MTLIVDSALGESAAATLIRWQIRAIDPLLAPEIGTMEAAMAPFVTPSAFRAKLLRIVAAFALFHGVAHGQELVGSAALAGMVIATASLHGAGLAIGTVLRTRAPWLGRTAGAMVGVAGLAMLVH